MSNLLLLIKDINTITHKYIPICILLNFILLLILIYINRSYIIALLLSVKKSTWLLILLITILSFTLRIFLPGGPSHLIFIDEQWYMEAASTLADTGLQGNYVKSIGWPFILSIIFKVFGSNNWIALYTSIIFGTLTSFVIFLLSYVVTKKQLFSIFPALIFALSPIHIFWSTSAETNIFSIFFTVITILFWFIFYKEKTPSLLWLSVILMAFAAQIRPENYIFPLLFLSGYLIIVKYDIYKNLKLMNVLPWIIFIIIVTPNLIQVVDFNFGTHYYQGGYNNGNWMPSKMANNFFIELYRMISMLPFFVVILFIFGLIKTALNHKKELFIFSTWFMLLWLFYFFSWFQTLDFKTNIIIHRFYLFFYLIIAIFVVYGILYIQTFIFRSKNFQKLFFIVLFSLIVCSFIPQISYTYESYALSKAIKMSQLETKIPELAEKDIPPECMIIATQPSVLTSTTDLQAIMVEHFLGDEKLRENIFDNHECILFFEDKYCFGQRNYKEDIKNKKKCQEIISLYGEKPFKTYSQDNLKFTFYNIKN